MKRRGEGGADAGSARPKAHNLAKQNAISSSVTSRASSNVTPLQTRDLHDLFTLGADIEGGTETAEGPRTRGTSLGGVPREQKMRSRDTYTESYITVYEDNVLCYPQTCRRGTCTTSSRLAPTLRGARRRAISSRTSPTSCSRTSQVTNPEARLDQPREVEEETRQA